MAYKAKLFRIVKPNLPNSFIDKKSLADKAIKGEDGKPMEGARVEVIEVQLDRAGVAESLTKAAAGQL